MPCAAATVGQSGAPSGAAGAPQGLGLGEAKARVQAKLEKYYKLRFARDGKLCQRMKAKLLKKSGHPAWRETMGVSWQADAILAVLLGRDAEIVSACGSGKGDVLALTAFAIGGVVFYVCPLVAVVADFVRRLRAMGIFAHFFRGSGGEAEDALVRKIQDHPRTAPAVVVALLPGTIPR